MNLADRIEHTALRADTDIKAVQAACDMALKNRFAGVCVPPYFVRDARRFLGEGFRIPKLVTVAGFPMGYSAIAAKSEEIMRSVEDGADEIDVVANLAAVKSGNWNHVTRDIDSCTRAAHLKGCIIKVIFEVGLLSEQEILSLIDVCVGNGVDYVKTGTGMHGHDATAEQVRFLRAHLPENIKIKAAGGIRDRQRAEGLVAAGAARLGTSAGRELI